MPAKKSPSLEKIATLLLNGKMSRQEAEDLSKKAPIRSHSGLGRGHKVIMEDEGFRVVDKKGKIKAYADFYISRTLSEGSFLRITQIESYERFNGDASLLLRALYSFASKNGLNFILAEVDRGNDDAIEVFNRENFYPVGEAESCGLNLEREIVRKDISI